MMSITVDARAQRLILSAIVAIATISSTAPLAAQQLYRYRDANGEWVYSDRRPGDAVADTQVEQYSYAADFVLPEVTLERRPTRDGIAIVARNTWHSHVQIAYRISNAVNTVPADGAALANNAVLNPRSETELLRFSPQTPQERMSFEIAFQHIPGRPGAAHAARRPYRMPFALATSWQVSQAFPSTMTHGDPSSAHAIDFVMPIGTGVYAARSGTVIQIADENYSAGLDPDTDLARANIVRILHDDGTMSLYAHLNWNSIRVRPGQTIERGEYIADSGNTGFSSGPHLHFVVQRNVGGAIESVPVDFAGSGDLPVRLTTGDRATAH
jgi:murein DD-endopeptidase MepM/ murein hydrolase activator NlpD